MKYADSVSLGKVLCLLGVLPGLNQSLHRRIGLAGLGKDGEHTGLGGSSQLLALLVGLGDQIQTQDLIEVRQNRQLGLVVGLVLQHIVDRRNGQRPCGSRSGAGEPAMRR